MKSVPSFTSFAAVTVARSIVPPILTTADPAACLASLPVSISITRPSASSILLLITFIIVFLYVFLRKKGWLHPGTIPHLSYRRLSTETELLDDISVSLDVNFLEVVQNLTSLTYEAEK